MSQRCRVSCCGHSFESVHYPVIIVHCLTMQPKNSLGFLICPGKVLFLYVPNQMDWSVTAGSNLTVVGYC